MNPIYIPSRHRPECKTAQLLSREGIDFSIVIEPHDWDAYSKVWDGDNIIILHEDNKGLGYSRNFIKTWSEDQGEKYHWQLDDDIRGFMLREIGQPSQRLQGVKWALTQADNLMDQYANLGIVGFNQNSWPPKGTLLFNELPDQALLINNKIPYNYRTDIPLMATLDVLLESYRQGFCSAMFDNIRVISPPIGKSPGGLDQVYASLEKKRKTIERLTFLWPELQMELKEDGRIALRKKKCMRKYMVEPLPRY